MANLCPNAPKYTIAVMIIQLLNLRPRPTGQGPCLMQVDWLGQLVLERANATSTGQDQDEASDDKKVLSMMTLGWESSKDEDEEEWKCGDLGHRRASHWTRLGKR